MRELTAKLKDSLLGIYQLEAINHLKIFLEGEIGLMFLLFQAGNQGMPPTVISEKLQVTKGRVTAMINSLNEKNYIEITMFPDDRRKLLIFLTKEGIAFLSEKMIIGERYFDIMIERIGEHKTIELIDLISEIVDKMKEV